MAKKQTEPETTNPDDRSCEYLFQRLAGEQATLRSHDIPRLTEALRFASRQAEPDPGRVAALLGDSSSVATMPVQETERAAAVKALNDAKQKLADLDVAVPIAENRWRQEKERRTAYHKPQFTARLRARDVELAGLLAQIQGVIAESKADLAESARLGLVLNCRSREFFEVDNAIKDVLFGKRSWIREQTQTQ